MVRVAVVSALGLVLVASGCSAPREGEGEDQDETDDLGATAADALTGSQFACAVSQVAGNVQFAGVVVCWAAALATEGAASPVCVWLSSAGVTAASLANGAAQCVTGCGGNGQVCQSVARSLEAPTGYARTSARITNVGCNARGDYAAEADVCGAGLNRLYPRGTREASRCVPGTPTGFWALSPQQRAYLRDRANCRARGFSGD